MDCVRRAVTIAAALVVLCSLATGAHAQRIETRAELVAILTDTEQIEDYEGISLHAGSSIPVANPLSATTAPSLGIQAGVVYSSPGALSIYAGFFGGDESNILRAEDQLDVSFTEPQRAVGFDLLASGGSYVVSFYDEIGILGEISVSASGFIGWQDWVFGVTSVRVVRTDGGLVSSDNVTWGRVVPECPADFALPTGTLDFSDIVAFLVAFSDTEDNADMAPPFGVWDFSDVVQYLTTFGAGCP